MGISPFGGGRFRRRIQLNHEGRRFAFAIRGNSRGKVFKYFAKLIARRRRAEISYDPYRVALFEHVGDFAQVGV